MNPTLNPNYFYGYGQSYDSESIRDRIYNKIEVLFLILIIGAGGVWYLFLTNYWYIGVVLLGVGTFLGLIFALITIFVKKWAAVTAPIYALMEGLALGGISFIFEGAFPGIVFEAVALTFAVFMLMLFLYKKRIIRATRKFVIGIVAATFSIMIVYVLTLILNFFGSGIPYIYDTGPIGILFSLAVVTVAALNLIIDFDFIDKVSRKDLPKYMQWYTAFGLMVTLVWLYVEILRLLAKMRSRE